ncbi:MAG: hypothetical protein NTX82_01015 [Candidatus Parcubacteria bacterium]|nr:hypothetical protein [Candidatus Parcubacteria bacterium]
MAKKGDTELVMNKIIQKGLTSGGELKPEIQAIFDSLGLEVRKVVHQNGDPWTQSGDQISIYGPKPIMNALLALFPKGFMTSKHCPLD